MSFDPNSFRRRFGISAPIDQAEADEELATSPVPSLAPAGTSPLELRRAATEGISAQESFQTGLPASLLGMASDLMGDEGEDFGRDAMLQIQQAARALGAPDFISDPPPTADIQARQQQAAAGRELFGIERSTMEIIREDVPAAAGMIAIDIPTFFVPGGIGFKILEKTTRLGRAAPFARGLIESSSLFGAADFGREALTQTKTGEFDPGRLVAQTIKGGIIGAALSSAKFLPPGLAKGPEGQLLKDTIGRKVVRQATRTTGEIGVFGGLSPALEGHVPTYDDFVAATALVAGFRAYDMVRRGPTRLRADLARKKASAFRDLNQKETQLLTDVERMLRQAIPPDAELPPGTTYDQVIQAGVEGLRRQMETGKFDIEAKIEEPLRRLSERRATAERERVGPVGLEPPARVLERREVAGEPLAVRRQREQAAAERGVEPEPDPMRATRAEIEAFSRGARSADDFRRAEALRPADRGTATPAADRPAQDATARRGLRPTGVPPREPAPPAREPAPAVERFPGAIQVVERDGKLYAQKLEGPRGKPNVVAERPIDRQVLEELKSLRSDAEGISDALRRGSSATDPAELARRRKGAGFRNAATARGMTGLLTPREEKAHTRPRGQIQGQLADQGVQVRTPSGTDGTVLGWGPAGVLVKVGDTRRIYPRDELNLSSVPAVAAPTPAGVTREGVFVGDTVSYTDRISKTEKVGFVRQVGEQGTDARSGKPVGPLGQRVVIQTVNAKGELRDVTVRERDVKVTGGIRKGDRIRLKETGEEAIVENVEALDPTKPGDFQYEIRLMDGSRDIVGGSVGIERVSASDARASLEHAVGDAVEYLNAKREVKPGVVEGRTDDGKIKVKDLGSNETFFIPPDQLRSRRNPDSPTPGTPTVSAPEGSVPTIENYQRTILATDSVSKGGGVETEVRAPGVSYPARFVAVDARDLQPSHNIGSWQRNKKFPSGLQERDYESQAHERLKVEQAANDFASDPIAREVVLSKIPVATDGTPVITNGGVVPSGNGRALAIQLIYESGRGADFRKDSIAFGQRVGIPVEELNKIERLVIARELKETPGSPEAFNAAMTKMNGGLGHTVDTSGKAISRARQVSDRTLEFLSEQVQELDAKAIKAAARATEKLRQEDAEAAEVAPKAVSVADVFNNAKTVRKMVERLRSDGVITNENVAEFLVTEGKNEGRFHAQGRLLAESILIGRVLGSRDTMVAIAGSRMSEKILAAAPQIARAEKATDFPIREIVSEAAESLVRMDVEGTGPIDLHLREIAEGNPTPAQRDARVGAMARFLDSRPGGKAQKVGEVREAFSEFAKRTREEPADMFKDRVPSEDPVVVFDDVFKRGYSAIELGPTQTTMMDSPRLLLMPDGDLFHQSIIERRVPVQQELFRLDQATDRPTVTTIPEPRQPSRHGVVTLAKSISSALRLEGDWRPEGKTARTPEDIATIAQFIRNPTMEHNLMLAIKGGKVLGFRHVTSKLPAAVSSFAMSPRDIQRISAMHREGKHADANREMQRVGRKAIEELNFWARGLGADAVYTIHNHPSGLANPSRADVNVFRTLKREMPLLKDSIVLDHNRFARISLKEDVRSGTVHTRDDVEIERRAGAGRDTAINLFVLPKEITRRGDSMLVPELEHPLLGRTIPDYPALAAMARSVVTKGEHVALFHFRNDNRLRQQTVGGVQKYPLELFRGESKEARQIIEQSVVGEFGSLSTAAVYEGRESVVVESMRGMVQDGFIDRVILPEGMPAGTVKQIALSGGANRQKFGQFQAPTMRAERTLREEGLPVTSKERGLRRFRDMAGEATGTYTAEPVPPEPRGSVAPAQRVDRPTGQGKARRSRAIPGGVQIEVTDKRPKFKYAEPERQFEGDVAAFVKETADRFPELMEQQRRGRLSLAQQRQLATKWSSATGFDASKYADFKQGMVLPFEAQIELYTMIDSAVRTMQERSGQVRAVDADLARATSPAERARLQERKIDLESQVEQLSHASAALIIPWYKTGSELGRSLGLRSQKIPTIEKITRRGIQLILDERRLSPEGQQRLIQQVVEAGGDRTKVIRAVEEAYIPSLWDKFIEFRVMMLLSSPVTHSRNILGNSAALATRVLETAVGVPVDAMYELTARTLGKQPKAGERRTGVELAADLQGTYTGIIEGARLALRSVVTPKEQAPGKSLRERFIDAEAFAQSRGRIGAEALQFKNAIKGSPVEDAIGPLLRIPGRALSAADLFFSHSVRVGEIYRLATRKAVNEGLVGAARNHRINALVKDAREVEFGRVQELARESARIVPTTEGEGIARKGELAAREFTFRSELGRLGKLADSARFMPGVPGKSLRFLIPFLPTPLNIVKFNAQRMPVLSFFSERNRHAFTRAEGREDLVDSVARMAVGSAVFAPVLALALEGYISGAPPKQKAARVAKERTGWQPWSVRLPEVGWTSYRGFSPMTEILAVAAEAAEGYHQDGALMTEQFWTRTGFAVARQTMDQPFLTGVSDLIEAVTDDRYGESRILGIAQNATAGTVIPRGLAFLARAMDPTLRAFPETLGARLSQEWPGTRRETIPFRDPLGRTFDSPNAWLNAWVRHREDKPITLVDEMLFAVQQSPERAVIGYPARHWLGRRTDSSTYDALLQRRGELLLPVLTKLARSGVWRRADPFAIRKLIDTAKRDADQVARIQTLPAYELTELGLPPTVENIKRLMAINATPRLRVAYTATDKADERIRIIRTGRP